MNLKERMIDLASLMTVSGFESRAHAALRAKLGGIFDEITTDAVGSVICTKRCGRAGAPTILVDAHIDEIGMMVTEILDGGFLRVLNLGGIDTRIMPAAEVCIYGTETIYGVVASTPPHLQKPDAAKKLTPITELLIDTGYSRERLEQIVPLGTPIGFVPRYTELLGGKISGKGFDDKACAAIAIAAIESVEREALAGDVTLLLAVQEETTMLGGTTGAAGIDPDYALVTDVTFGETPDTKKGDAFPLGSGVVISLSAVTDRRLTARTVELAKDKGIGYHRSVEPTGTGTDANATQLTNCGIPTVVVSLPLRYMHTYHELISNDDAEALRSLIAAFLADRSIAEEFGR